MADLEEDESPGGRPPGNWEELQRIHGTRTAVRECSLTIIGPVRAGPGLEGTDHGNCDGGAQADRKHRALNDLSADLPGRARIRRLSQTLHRNVLAHDSEPDGAGPGREECDPHSWPTRVELPESRDCQAPHRCRGRIEKEGEGGTGRSRHLLRGQLDFRLRAPVAEASQTLDQTALRTGSGEAVCSGLIDPEGQAIGSGHVEDDGGGEACLQEALDLLKGVGLALLCLGLTRSEEENREDQKTPNSGE